MPDSLFISGLLIFTVNFLYFAWVAIQWGKYERHGEQSRPLRESGRKRD
jgi:hypothetical protein